MLITLQTLALLNFVDVGGIKFCDVGCLEGNFILYMAQKYPLCHFTGIDALETAIDAARRRAQLQNITNVDFIAENINILSETLQEAFDYIFICHTLHDLSHPTEAATNMFKMVKPGGKLFAIEFDVEDTLKENAANELMPVYYTISLYYCLSTGSCDSDNHCLGTVAGKGRLKNVIESVGFVNVNFFPIPKDLQNVFIVADKI